MQFDHLVFNMSRIGRRQTFSYQACDRTNRTQLHKLDKASAIFQHQRNEPQTAIKYQLAR